MCTISIGDLPIRVNWLLNGKDISLFSGVITNQVSKKISALSIDSVDESHAGEYTCVASNAAGNTSVSAVLQVNGTLNIY